MKHSLERLGRAATAVLFAIPLCGCLSRELQTGLDEQEAQEICVALNQNGLDARASREKAAEQNAAPKWTVTVRGGDDNLVLAWRILKENGLPRQKVKGFEDVYASTGMIPTATEEKAKLLLALSGELTRTLKSVAGVTDARVQVVLPENSPLLDKSQWSPPTASVLVKHRWARPPLSEDEVKRLVARGVEGLQPENVAVVFKKVQPVETPARDIGWYLSDGDVVIAALSLMMVAALGSLALVFRSRRQRATIESLRAELAAGERRAA